MGRYLLQVNEKIRKVVSFLNKNGYINLIKKGSIKYNLSTYKSGIKNKNITFSSNLAGLYLYFAIYILQNTHTLGFIRIMNGKW